MMSMHVTPPYQHKRGSTHILQRREQETQKMYVKRKRMNKIKMCEKMNKIEKP